MNIKRTWKTNSDNGKVKKFTEEFITDTKKALALSMKYGADIRTITGVPDVNGCMTDEMIWFTPNEDNKRQHSFVLIQNNSRGEYRSEDKPYDIPISAVLLLALKHGIITELKADNDYIPKETLEILKTIEMEKTNDYSYSH